LLQVAQCVDVGVKFDVVGILDSLEYLFHFGGFGRVREGALEDEAMDVALTENMNRVLEKPTAKA